MRQHRAAAIAAIIIITSIVVGVISTPAGAQGSSWEVEIPERVARGPEGSERPVARISVPSALVGASCGLYAEGLNQESTHIGNDLIVRPGEIEMLDVERESFAITPASGRVVLSSELRVWVRLGEGEVFSGGLRLVFDCAPEASTTSTTQPTSTSSTLPEPETSTTTLPEPETSTTTLPEPETSTTSTTQPTSTSSTIPEPEPSFEAGGECLQIAIENRGPGALQARMVIDGSTDFYRSLAEGERWSFAGFDSVGLSWRIERGIWADQGPAFEGWVYEVVAEGVFEVCGSSTSTSSSTTVPPVTGSTLPFTGAPVEMVGVALAGAALLLLGAGAMLAAREG